MNKDKKFKKFHKKLVGIKFTEETWIGTYAIRKMLDPDPNRHQINGDPKPWPL
jgi:hypothetical protein